MAIPTYDWIAHYASTRGNCVAMEDLATGRSFTYIEFDQRVGRLAAIVGADEIVRLPRCRVLLRRGEIRPGRTVLANDALRQQIQDGVAAFRNVGAVNVIKGPVLTDHDDDVLDRRGGW